MQERKYTIDDIKKINDKISQLGKRKYYIRLFNIVKENNINTVKNSNGHYFKLHNLSDDVLEKIDNFCDKALKHKKKTSSGTTISSISESNTRYCDDEFSSEYYNGNHLSNKEKAFLKKQKAAKERISSDN